MFPNGVIYKGVSDTPLSFRGESGANDSMVDLTKDPLPPPQIVTIANLLYSKGPAKRQPPPNLHARIPPYGDFKRLPQVPPGKPHGVPIMGEVFRRASRNQEACA